MNLTIEQQKIVLGSAMWGWTVAPDEALRMLSAFYEAGFRWIDTASTYPVNGNAADHGLVVKLVSQWIAAHGVEDLRVIYKFGGLSNARSELYDLTPAAVSRAADNARTAFKFCLGSLMVHWDNRAGINDIQSTLERMRSEISAPVRLGLSGLGHPELWAACLGAGGNLSPIIELKHGIFESVLENYQNTFARLNPTYLAYGLTSGGFAASDQARSFQVRSAGRLSEEKINSLEQAAEKHRLEAQRSVFPSLYAYALARALDERQTQAVIIGPATVAQLQESMAIASGRADRI